MPCKSDLEKMRKKCVGAVDGKEEEEEEAMQVL